MELNKKRESEVIDKLSVDNPEAQTNITFFSEKVTKLRKDLEECRIQHDATLVSLKKKQADSIAEVIFMF